MVRARERGATLLDVVVGSALMMVVFAGIAGAFRLAVDAVLNNKARAGAIALANEQLEFLRSLSYDAAGTFGGIPSGEVAQEESVVLNDVTYTRRTLIAYADDPHDGLGQLDSVNGSADYKAVKVSVSWPTKQGNRILSMVTRLSPPGLETEVPGGTIVIQVVNAAAAPLSGVLVHVYNPTVSPAVDLTRYTDESGTATVIGATPGAGYEITVSRPGYSTARTYSATAENTNPSPAHLGVALNQTTAASFAIDLLGSLTVQTLLPIAQATSTEEFIDSSAVATIDGAALSGGTVQLASGEEGFLGSGTILSVSYATSSLARWGSFVWEGTEPAGTDIRFHFYDASGSSLISEAQIPGNAAGVTASAIDLSQVSTSTYPIIRIQAELSTSDPSLTPSLDSWALSSDSGPLPIPQISFTMVGAKTIGSGPGGPVYKFDQALETGTSGVLEIVDLEYDTYTLAVAESGFALLSSCPPQPNVLVPGAHDTTQLFLAPATTHSLLIDVKSAGLVVPGASVRVSRTSPAFDTTIVSDACGQAYFGDIQSGAAESAYSISVTASGFAPYTTSGVSVSGPSQFPVILDAN